MATSMIYHESIYCWAWVGFFYLHVNYALSLQASVQGIHPFVAPPVRTWKFRIVIGFSDPFPQLLLRITCRQHQFGQLHLVFYKGFSILSFRILQPAQLNSWRGQITQHFKIDQTEDFWEIERERRWCVHICQINTLRHSRIFSGMLRADSSINHSRRNPYEPNGPLFDSSLATLLTNHAYNLHNRFL